MKKVLILAFVALLGTIFVVTAATGINKDSQSLPAEKWEYKVVYATFDVEISKGPSDFAEQKIRLASEIGKKFNAMGIKGWELVSYDRKSDIAVFKRRIKDIR